MLNPHFKTADDYFNSARMKAVLGGIFSILNPEKKEILSFYDIKDLIKPKAEFYMGVKTIPLDLIVGSEGRYNDFNRAFLPKHEHLRKRWRSISIAALEDVDLPPIKVFKIGEIYFVRDGNHRVSVARLRGQIDIDAEVTEITSEIKISPDITIKELKKKVIDFELNRIIERTGLDEWINLKDIKFTAPGRYEEILRHIIGHQEYLSLHNNKDVTLENAAHSWFLTVYLPVISIIIQEKLIDRFPDRTEADIYVWVIKHWNDLGDRYGAYPKIKKRGDLHNTFTLHNSGINIKRFFRTVVTKLKK